VNERSKENATSDPLIAALLGHDSQALTDDVSLATPLTSSRIAGRRAVVEALGVYADPIGRPTPIFDSNAKSYKEPRVGAGRNRNSDLHRRPA
jgi:hypothetical protein